jgi:hypothetical protein
VELEIHAVALHVGGVFAKDGMDCELAGNAVCDLQLDLSGSIPGRITKAAIEMAADADSGE